jgi:hypothetical protein
MIRYIYDRLPGESERYRKSQTQGKVILGSRQATIGPGTCSATIRDANLIIESGEVTVLGQSKITPRIKVPLSALELDPSISNWDVHYTIENVDLILPPTGLVEVLPYIESLLVSSSGPNSYPEQLFYSVDRGQPGFHFRETLWVTPGDHIDLTFNQNLTLSLPDFLVWNSLKTRLDVVKSLYLPDGILGILGQLTGTQSGIGEVKIQITPAGSLVGPSVGICSFNSFTSRVRDLRKIVEGVERDVAFWLTAAQDETLVNTLNAATTYLTGDFT